MKNVTLLACCFCLLFLSSCYNNYYPERAVQQENYYEHERMVGKHVYDFYWALSQNKPVQAALYATNRGWKSVLHVSGDVNEFNIRQIELYGNRAEVEVIVNRQQLTKVLLIKSDNEWMIHEAAALTRSASRSVDRNNSRTVNKGRRTTKNNSRTTTTRRSNSKHHSKGKNSNNSESIHLSKQKIINNHVEHFYSALNRKDIKTAERFATARGLESVMNLPMDYVDRYEIDNIFLYGDIADVEVLINGNLRTLTFLVKDNGKWLIDGTNVD